MGLDMYLEGRKFLWAFDKKDVREEDGFRIKEFTLELGYWRKHPNLHGFIVKTFAGGEDKCQEIALGADDIRKIVAAVQGAELPHTEGFFFGRSEGNEAEQERDVAIFKRALAWLGDTASEQPGLEPGMPLGDSGLAIAIVKVPKVMPTDSRRVIYRASW